jgi:hypothetical protein
MSRETRRRAFKRPPNVQDLYLAFERYCDHERGETAAARLLDAAAAEIITKAMAGSRYHEQLCAEVWSRGIRLPDRRHRVCHWLDAKPGSFVVSGMEAT